MRQLFVEISREVTFFGDRLTDDYRPKDLHGMRIRIRRIRSLLKQIDNLHARYFRKTWGGFAAVTNQARDWDVFLKSARAMLSTTEFQVFRTMFTPQVRASHEAVFEVLQSAQWQRHLADWEQFLSQIDDLTIEDGRAQWSVEDATAKASSACWLALAANDQKTWHKFRIAIKNLRYIADAQIRDPACDQQYLDEVIKTCKKLQTRLGKWHDAVVQLQMIREQEAAVENKAIVMMSALAETLEQKKHLLLSQLREKLAEQTLFEPENSPDVRAPDRI